MTLEPLGGLLVVLWFLLAMGLGCIVWAAREIRRKYDRC